MRRREPIKLAFHTKNGRPASVVFTPQLTLFKKNGKPESGVHNPKKVCVDCGFARHPGEFLHAVRRMHVPKGWVFEDASRCRLCLPPEPIPDAWFYTNGASKRILLRDEEGDEYDILDSKTASGRPDRRPVSVGGQIRNMKRGSRKLFESRLQPYPDR